MEALLGAILCILIIVAGLRALKFCIRMVHWFFDWLEERF